ncbi:hypothetical protein JXA40_10170 [bacterium]|nr:hypothetical protein [candidate division CSSED10-310 bacterium]
MNIAMDFWTWTAALLTLAILSFLWKDNPTYRAAEHLYIGVANGYSVTLIWYNVVVPNMIDPIAGAYRQVAREGMNWSVLNPFQEANFFVIIPMMVGALYITRFIPKISWMVRIPIGLTLGYYTAISIPASFEASILRQLEASIVTRAHMTMGFRPALWVFLVLIGTLSTLIYFFFSTEHRGILKPISNFGILVVMIGFGASFGLTVMARISLAIGRFVFLFKDWLGLVY